MRLNVKQPIINMLIVFAFADKIGADIKERKNTANSCTKCIDLTTKIAQVIQFYFDVCFIY